MSKAERTQLDLTRRIGRGGFGEVYHGLLTSSSGVRHQVAVKLLGAHLDPRSQALQRLLDEGRILASLDHPSILRVHDLVTVADRVALVSEYVRGADLDQLFAWTGPGPTVRAYVEILGHVASALHAARETTVDGKKLDLVHRDIKPSNIRLTPHGSVKLLDFGIAKTNDEERESHTQANIMLGSLAWLAPEVLSFQVENGSHAADIYALGCTLYQALTGEKFTNNVPRNRMAGICTSDIRFSTFVDRRCQLLPEDTPLEVHGILRELLRRNPAERPTAQQLAQRCLDVADALEGDRLYPWAQRTPWPDDVPGDDGPHSHQNFRWKPLHSIHAPVRRDPPMRRPAFNTSHWDEPDATSDGNSTLYFEETDQAPVPGIPIEDELPPTVFEGEETVLRPPPKKGAPGALVMGLGVATLCLSIGALYYTWQTLIAT